MKSLSVKVSEIFEEFSRQGLLLEQAGTDVMIKRIESVNDCRPGDLVFVEAAEHLELALHGQASAVVVPAHLKEKASSLSQLSVLVAANVKLAHALIKQRYSDRHLLLDEWQDSIHPSAVIHPSAQIAEGCSIGPHVSIGKNAVIGKRCRIFAGVVIEHSVTIGDDCVLFANSVVGYESILGNSVEIGMGTVIGSEGFGFAQDEKRKSHRLPQTGYVHIEDRVRLGSNNVIDRAAYGKTRIGAGTKTDNLCHFAHGVNIGEDCLLTAMFCIAGSTTIGDRVMTSGQTGMLDHLNIASDSVFVHRAGVLKNIDQPGLYAGLPAQPFQQYSKNIAQFRNLNELAQRVKQLEKALAKSDSEDKPSQNNTDI